MPTKGPISMTFRRLDDAWKMATLLAFYGPVEIIQLRPVSVLLLRFFVYKFLKMVSLPLVHFLKLSSLLSLSRCGFDPSHFTLDSPFKLESNVCRAFFFFFCKRNFSSILGF